jgi:hypothetical protein
VRAHLDLDLDDLVEAVAVRVVQLLEEREQQRSNGRPVSGWLDARAAAEYAGTSIHSLHRAMAAREVQFTNRGPGRKAYFRKVWLDAWREGE